MTFWTGILFACVVALAYRIGWENAHEMVSKECERTGSFFVGKKTYHCIKVEVKP